MHDGNGWGRGGWRPGAGRPKGSMENTGISPKELRACVIEAAKNSRYGIDPEHPDQPGSLTRFFISICNDHPVAFITLFGKLLPRHVFTQTETNVDVTFRTHEEIVADMQANGWSPQQIEMIQAMLPVNDIEISPDDGIKRKAEEDADEQN